MKHYIKGAIFFFCITSVLQAREIPNGHRISGPPQNPPHVFAGCEPSKSRADLDVNNVRCPIFINGDMWWDLAGTALYEVPVGSGKHSLFAGAIWFGGKDGTGQLKVAAQTYRQSGSDFWPGPIDTANTIISADACLNFDKHFKITFSEVKNFHEQYQVKGDINYPIPDIIKNWPGNGNVNPPYNQSINLAPFYDRSGDGIYDYNDGDYPKYDVDAILDPCDKNRLLGDQTIWWVFNDVGNSHGETGSLLPVGVEIQAQAFGFNTNDEINNMTFYRYKIINRSQSILKDTYFGSWVDPDLGNYLDDFVGCDVMRGLGFCYNGDADDDGALGYGLNPPAVGMDFFEGPEADANDSIDNNRNGIIDEPGEQIIMSKFVYYNNDFTNIGNPSSAQHYYNYLDGKWKNNSPLVYGGTGFQSGGDTCDFMFPGTSDPLNYGTHGLPQTFAWSETVPCPTCVPNTPSDRRFLQSAGKFTLLPGKVNFITTGVVWARTSSGGPEASIKLLKIADVKAQNLFESCFKVLDGPDAPELSIRELDKEIIISMTNPATSNNAKEGYREHDSNIPIDPNADFIFEGYKVFQVKDPSVSINDLHNADKARLVFQSDIKNGLSQIVNKILDGDLNAYLPTEEVNGADKGLRHSFRLTTDAFATGDPGLINHKTYYFLAIAYAYDSVADVLDPFEVGGRPGLFGQPYIQSRKNADGTAVSVYTAIPHIIAPEADGLLLNTTYNDGPEITRITGTGNGYIIGSDRSTLNIKQDQINSILFNQASPNNKILYPTYERGRGPVDIRVYDPVKIPQADFELWLTDTISNKEIKGVLTGGTSSITNVPNVATLHAGLSLSSLWPSFPQGAVITNITNVGVNNNTIDISKVILGNATDSNKTVNVTARWVLKNMVTGRIDTSEKSLETPYDELFPEYGFYINLNQVTYPGQYPAGGNGAIGGTIEYSNPNNRWLTFIPDIDNFVPFNWILAGNNTDNTIYDPIDFVDLDGSQFYEKILGGTWAPYKLVSYNPNNQDYIGPSPLLTGTAQPQELDSLLYLGSVDVVFTSDKSKWSRCVVYEEGRVPANNEGSQTRGLLRKHASLNLDGTYSTDPNDVGRSWFPGYAINIETGERLNIAFGEDSHLAFDNGNDMIWNPSSRTIDENMNLFAAGKHYVYVFGHNAPEALTNQNDTGYYCPAYDSCNWIFNKLRGINFPVQSSQRPRVQRAWQHCMWVSVPILSAGQTLLSTDVRVRLRISKPYRQFDTGVSNSVNNNFPYYKFGTYDLSAKVNQTDVAKSALSLINVVPNPYYAYSNYENNQLDNRIKIVNIPNKCVVSIYTTNGTLIRRFKRDAGAGSDYNNTAGTKYPDVNLENSLDWDLKNSQGIPIASGIYLIHIQADGIGERTLKWFGVLRPIDLDTF